jgi:hypothetical protein
MSRQLRVHSLHFTTELILVKTEDGDEVEAKMPLAIVELVCPAAKRTTITHHERVPKPRDVERIKALFPVGGTVQIEFKLIAPPTVGTGQ